MTAIYLKKKTHKYFFTTKIKLNLNDFVFFISKFGGELKLTTLKEEKNKSKSIIPMS